MATKEAIKYAISVIPSKTLREAYEKDMEIGIYPDWDEADLCTIIFQSTYDSIKRRRNALKEISKHLQNKDLVHKVDALEKEIMHKGNNFRYNFVTEEFEKYVKTKVLYKSGDIIEYKVMDTICHGMVNNGDYGASYDELMLKVGDSSDMMYTVFDLSNTEYENPHAVYECHYHPNRLYIETAHENSLTEREKEYAKILREKYLFADSKKIQND